MDFNQNKGFTLIEILISVAIITLLMGISAYHFNAADKSEFVRSAARRLADALGSAQSYAQSGIVAQYPAAQSYGVHTDLTSQQIVVFADQNITNGVGRWNSGAADAGGKTDAVMQQALSYDVRGRGDIRLDAIDVAYVPAPTEPCTKDTGGNCHTPATSIDVAAAQPNARIIVGGIIDKATNTEVSVSNIASVAFTIKNTKTNSAVQVIMHALSGRIDVDY